LGYWPKIRDLLNQHCGYTLADDEVILLMIAGTAYYIADITLRMLTPRELYNAMGFPPDYVIDRDYMGNEYGKTKQVARCGNAVCPPLAEAMVRANLPEWCSQKITTMRQLDDAVAV
jgi:DNA (cytosine-5)-methyltransferase 1